MARYWVYMNGEVAGPYSIEQLLRLRDFSRQTQVCEEDGSGQPRVWISLSQVPELSHIFQKSDQLHEAPTPRPKPKPAPKPFQPVRRPPPVAAPAPAPAPAPMSPWPWIAGSAVALAAFAGAWLAFKSWHAGRQQAESTAAVQIVRHHSLPADSLYATLEEYILDKRIKPRWEVEAGASGLFNVTASWGGAATTPPVPSAVYAFQVNRDAQTVRGINTAAQKLLSDVFPRASAKSSSSAPATSEPKKPAAFEPAMNQRRDAFEKGDFPAVWQAFSERRRTEMVRAGMSEAGFVRLQSLTRGLEPTVTQQLVKTKVESPDRRLVLLRQVQPKHPDLLIKQTWVLEDKQWKLDDEEKRTASIPASEPATAVPSDTDTTPAARPTDAGTTPPPTADKPDRQKILSLPGLSGDAAH